MRVLTLFLMAGLSRRVLGLLLSDRRAMVCLFGRIESGLFLAATGSIFLLRFGLYLRVRFTFGVLRRMMV